MARTAHPEDRMVTDFEERLAEGQRKLEELMAIEEAALAGLDPEDAMFQQELELLEVWKVG